MTTKTAAPAPKFPGPLFTDVDATFGADNRSFLTHEQLGDWYGLYGDNSHTPFHKAAEGLFFNGGALSDYGLSIKDGVDSAAVYKALKSLLRSFAPKHEIKIGTVAVALANWCDLADETA